jgi:uncharacterized Zn finger protein
MSWYDWRPYVPVAQRRRQAQQQLRTLKKNGRAISPVMIEGRTIAKSFWGKSWCANLERYSDYANRLPRGRSYIHNGSVIDLQIGKGEVSAWVSGSELYQIKIVIAPVLTRRWRSICADCAGSIDSVIELLQGQLAKGVMDRVCREGDGLFPSPKEITLSCSCPDWADMCKHVAAALYGVGARLDEQPQMLFVLRGVDENELLAGAGQNLALTKERPAAAKVLDADDVGALFGIDMAETPSPSAETPRSEIRSGRTAARSKAPVTARGKAKRRKKAAVSTVPANKPARRRPASRKRTANTEADRP